MSDTHGAESAEAETFDLTDVPMDGEDTGPADDDQGGDEDEAGGEPPERKAAADKAPLSVEEVNKRYENTRTALSEERRTRRALERRLEALERGDRAPAAERPQRQAQAEPEADIDPEEDPIGALKQMRAKVKAYEAAEQQENLTAAQRQTQERQLQTVESELQEFEADYRDEHPEYDQAAKHYAIARATELMEFGLDPKQIEPMLRKEFANLTSTAIKARKNPAAVIHQLAKGRGFGVKTPTDPKKPSKLEALERGQRNASPLSRTGGRPSNGLDAVTVANINIRDPKGGEAFDKAWDAMEREATRRR